MLGYGVGDHGMNLKIPRCKPIQPWFEMKDRRAVQKPPDPTRRPMSADLGCAVPGLAPIIPDTRLKLNQQVSILHRLATGHEVMARGTRRVLAGIMSREVKKVAIPMDIDFSWETMESKLRSRHKNQQYIDAMKEAFDLLEETDGRNRVSETWDKHMARVDGFIKEESYPNYKAPRNICAASDAHKVFFSPWFDLLEKIHETDPTCVKAIPVCDRIRFVRDRLERDGVTYAATDHTRFESGVSKEWMQLCIIHYFRPLLHHLPGYAMFERAMMKCSMLKKIHFKEWKCKIQATQFSGTRFTSFLNWLINKFGILFVARMSLCEIDFIAEGDDAIIAELRGQLDPKWYVCLCQDVKFERFTRLGDASFVGNLYSDSLQMIKDPWKVLINFGWSTSQYTVSSDKTLRTLARVKAHSLVAELPACPVLSEVGATVLRLTEGNAENVERLVSRMRLNEYQKDKLEILLAKPTNVHPIALETRLVFEQLFGIPVALQERIERDLRRKDSYGPLHEVLPLFDFMPFDRWLDASYSCDKYVARRIPGVKMTLYHSDFMEKGLTHLDFVP